MDHSILILHPSTYYLQLFLAISGSGKTNLLHTPKPPQLFLSLISIFLNFMITMILFLSCIKVITFFQFFPILSGCQLVMITIFSLCYSFRWGPHPCHFKLHVASYASLSRAVPFLLTLSQFLLYFFSFPSLLLQFSEKRSRPFVP